MRAKYCDRYRPILMPFATSSINAPASQTCAAGMIDSKASARPAPASATCWFAKRAERPEPSTTRFAKDPGARNPNERASSVVLNCLRLNSSRNWIGVAFRDPQVRRRDRASMRG